MEAIGVKVRRNNVLTQEGVPFASVISNTLRANPTDDLGSNMCECSWVRAIPAWVGAGLIRRRCEKDSGDAAVSHVHVGDLEGGECGPVDQSCCSSRARLLIVRPVVRGASAWNEPNDQSCDVHQGLLVGRTIHAVGARADPWPPSLPDPTPAPRMCHHRRPGPPSDGAGRHRASVRASVPRRPGAAAAHCAWATRRSCTSPRNMRMPVGSSESSKSKSGWWQPGVSSPGRPAPRKK
jgi:hypothetical protein